MRRTLRATPGKDLARDLLAAPSFRGPRRKPTARAREPRDVVREAGASETFSSPHAARCVRPPAVVTAARSSSFDWPFTIHSNSSEADFLL